MSRTKSFIRLLLVLSTIMWVLWMIYLMTTGAFYCHGALKKGHLGAG
jgi:hypothetical protein